jgi:hypothetical protein
MTRIHRLILTAVVRAFTVLGLLKPWNRSRLRLVRLALASTITALLGVAGVALIHRAPSVGLTLTSASAGLGGLTIITWWTTR